MWRRSAAPTSAGTGTTGTPAIRQPVMASTVVAVGLASTATRCAPPTRSATDVAAPTRSLRLSTAPSMRTASPMSAPPATAAGFSEASSTSARLPVSARHTWRVDEIRRIASREVYRNDWLTVREDQVRRPDGSDGIYGVVDKPTYSLIIACDGDRFRLSSSSGMRWVCAAGSSVGHRTGTSRSRPPPSWHRELREETGLRAGSMVAIGQIDVAPGMSSQRGRIFVATGITAGDHDREHTEQDMHSEWFSRSDVERMMRDGEITDAQSLAAWTLFLLSER